MACVHCRIVLALALAGWAARPAPTDAWAVGPADLPACPFDQVAAEWSADPIGIAYGIGTLLGAIIAAVLRWL